MSTEHVTADVKVFASSEGNVWKYVYDFGDAIAEAVLYKYEDFYKRTVICCSVQSGCPVGCVFCIPGDSRVLMSDLTYKRIADITEGDRIAGNDLTQASNGVTDYASRYSREMLVTRTLSRDYVGDLIELTTASGKVLPLTPEHPVPIHRDRYRAKFIPACDVRLGDRAIISDTSRVDLMVDPAWRSGWLVGFTEGDGTYSKRAGKNCARWNISQSEQALIEYAHGCCRDLGIRTTAIWKQATPDANKPNFRFEFGDEGIAVFNGLQSKYSNCPAFKRGWLAGFWDAEGYSFRHNKTVRVCNTNSAMLEKFSAYMETELGYVSRLNQTQRRNIKHKDMFVLDTSCPRTVFMQEVMPQHPKKCFLGGTRTKSITDFDPIVAIRRAPFSGRVYNIETDGNTYIANDVLVHNCGTGRRFVRNLTPQEIQFQIDYILAEKDIRDVNSRSEKFQIMFMSMGEPFLNMANVSDAITILAQKYGNAQLLVSTVGIDFPDPWVVFMRTSKAISRVGLQFSLHSAFEQERDKIIPFKNKFSTLRRLRDAGTAWAKATGRKVYLNYCVTDTNASDEEVERMMDLFTPEQFNFTFSVVCSADETAKDAGCRNYEKIDSLMQKFTEAGYNVRRFDPAGQDDIGGGCGQLWYVQEWLKEHGR